MRRSPPTSRPCLDRSRLILVLAAGLGLCLLGTGCGRRLEPAHLPPMIFASKRPPINAAVEACLTPELRLRIWDVIDHPHRIALGERASLNFEIMLKAVFRSVTTTFDADCGSSTSLPWLTARVDQADRELDGMFYDDQVTVITMTFKAFSADGEEIWATTTVGDTNAEPDFFAFRRTAAARDMGEALRKALELGYQAMLESDGLRQAIEEGPAQTPDAAAGR